MCSSGVVAVFIFTLDISVLGRALMLPEWRNTSQKNNGWCTSIAARVFFLGELARGHPRERPDPPARSLCGFAVLSFRAAPCSFGVLSFRAALILRCDTNPEKAKLRHTASRRVVVVHDTQNRSREVAETHCQVLNTEVRPPPYKKLGQVFCGGGRICPF